MDPPVSCYATNCFLLFSCYVREASLALKGLLVCPLPRRPRAKPDTTSDPCFGYPLIVWARASIVIPFRMFINYASCIRRCPCPAETLKECEKTSRSERSAQSQRSEDAVTFPKEIPFPCKQSQHWHRPWLVSCQGIPTMAPWRIMRSHGVLIQDFVGRMCVKTEALRKAM